MQTIQDYIKYRTEEGDKQSEISRKLGVSVCMVSSYKHNAYNPSLAVAKNVYKAEGIVLHPFAKESLEKEIADDTY